MKRLLLVILVVMAVLMAMVTGCSRAPRYDGRLVAADSLMRSDPDSALAVVEGVCRDSLAAEGDRAYRDLLLTQARYRCYVTATSDSDINRALTYYRAHSGEREKLTRAYIYKGAVMEELNHPDSAMLYYKHAEATADTNDYFNLGYIKMRMGALYRDYYATDGKHIIYFEKALECFNKTDNIDYQTRCMVRLGSLYCLNSPQKADSLLKAAIHNSEMTGDTIEYILAVQNLIKKCIHLKQFGEARQLIQKVLSMNMQLTDAAFYIYAADAYACLQMPDSAAILLALAEKKSLDKEIDKLAYIEVKRDIALACGDIELSQYYEQLGSTVEDSLLSLDYRQRITMMEDSVEEQSQNLMQQKHNSLSWKVSLLLIASLALLILSVSFFIKKHRYQKLATELSQSFDSQYQELIAYQESIKALDIRDGELKEFITTNISMMQMIIEECHHGATIQQIKHKIDEIVKFQHENSQQWLKMFSYIDLEYGNIMSITKQNYPHLNEKELMLLALSTLDCSCMQIATILGYSNASSIGPIRQRLAKKMNIDGSLMQYIQQFKSS